MTSGDTLGKSDCILEDGEGGGKLSQSFFRDHYGIRRTLSELLRSVGLWSYLILESRTHTCLIKQKRLPWGMYAEPRIVRLAKETGCRSSFQEFHRTGWPSEPLPLPSSGSFCQDGKPLSPLMCLSPSRKWGWEVQCFGSYFRKEEFYTTWTRKYGESV